MPKVSPALQWAMGTSTQYSVVYTMLAIDQTDDQFASDAHLGTRKISETSCITVTCAAMLSVLFGSAALMPAPQLTQGETVNCKTPQLWAQTVMFDCVHAVPAQSVNVLTIPILNYGSELSTDEHGNFDVSYVESEEIVAIIILSAIHYITMLMLYSGSTIVLVTAFMVQKPHEVREEQMAGCHLR